MCGFNIIKNINTNIELINFYCKKRGPDKTNIEVINDITFIHNLLSITGEITVQPFKKNNIYCVYNGEIYNYKDFGDYKSDGYCLIDLYDKYGINFTKKLDGEFAIVIFDFNKNYILLSTDVFSTKPLFYSIENNNYMMSSYASSIELNNMKNIKKLEANNTLILDLNTYEEIDRTYVYKFDLQQYKNSYDDWYKAFENAIEKRTRDLKQKVFVPLSSGYDSGLICCVLNNLNKKYKTYTILGSEDKDTLEKRFSINNTDYEILEFSNYTSQKYKERNFKFCCNSKYKFIDNYYSSYTILQSIATKKASIIYEKARLEKKFICLSGQGADEIISDYGFSHSILTCFNGVFPKNLVEIFPWKNFFGGINICYLMKEEIIGGSYGIEIRYPFLDKNVVQEYLWLSCVLKNKIYKAPIHYYLKKYNYPVYDKHKIGFGKAKKKIIIYNLKRNFIR